MWEKRRCDPAVSRLIGYSEESTPPELARRVEEIDLKVEGLKGDLRRLQRLIELADSTTTLKHDDLALDGTRNFFAKFVGDAPADDGRRVHHCSPPL